MIGDDVTISARDAAELEKLLDSYEQALADDSATDAAIRGAAAAALAGYLGATLRAATTDNDRPSGPGGGR